MTEAIIGAVRRNPSTVVVLAGQPGEQVLAAVSRSLNVVLVRPEPLSSGGDAGGPGTAVEAAAGALRRAAGIAAPYVLVAADPLSAVAAAWQAMWEITSGPRGIGIVEPFSVIKLMVFFDFIVGITTGQNYQINNYQ